jgi:three-Cys-motif partner protein
VNDAGIQEFGGPWTAIKIEILKKYLEAYVQALKYKPTIENPFDLIYIDAFAGAGEYRTKEKPNVAGLFDSVAINSSSVKSGSAKTALQLARPFQQYHFIDIDEQNIAHLHKLKESFPHLSNRIEIHRGSAKQHVERLCKKTDWRMKRAVLFLDPFNLEVSWDTIEMVAETESIDMWFLFPISAVNRMLAKGGVTDPGWERKLNEVFGSNSWKSAFYRKSGQMSIMDVLEPSYQKNTDFEGIKKYTINRLKEIFAGVSENPRVLRNSNNSPLFVLFFAVGNERGKKPALNIATHILNNT